MMELMTMVTLMLKVCHLAMGMPQKYYEICLHVLLPGQSGFKRAALASKTRGALAGLACATATVAAHTPSAAAAHPLAVPELARSGLIREHAHPELRDRAGIGELALLGISVALCAG